jgi:hypothetical protein
MPTVKLRTRHGGSSGRRDQLGSLAEMELWLGGPLPHLPPAFDSDEQRRAVWFRHRARLMENHGSRGRRPAAWWRYEAGDLHYPGYNRERSTLYEAGLLAEAERAELLAYWRGQFERAWDPNFFHCGGPGKILHGAAARRAHFEWADIPPALVEAWSAEHR